MKTDEKKEYIFTFGFRLKHEGCFVAIVASDPHDARSKMVERFGDQWSNQYDHPHARAKAGVLRWGLKELV